MKQAEEQASDPHLLAAGLIVVLLLVCVLVVWMTHQLGNSASRMVGVLELEPQAQRAVVAVDAVFPEREITPPLLSVKRGGQHPWVTTDRSVGSDGLHLAPAAPPP